jgi:hypothetical protein
MVSIMISKNLPNRYPNSNTEQILIHDGYHKMREPLYTQVLILGQYHPNVILGSSVPGDLEA